MLFFIIQNNGNDKLATPIDSLVKRHKKRIGFYEVEKTHKDTVSISYYSC